jgi:hypothetical protein
VRKEMPMSDLWIAVSEPALLAGHPLPTEATDWEALHDAGFRHVVALHPCEIDPAPLAHTHRTELEDLCDGEPPEDPDGERERIHEAAGAVVERLQAGEGVVVHCEGGTGRTGTVVGVALQLLGWDADETVRLLEDRRPGWPEAAWQEEVVRGDVAA